MAMFYSTDVQRLGYTLPIHIQQYSDSRKVCVPQKMTEKEVLVFLNFKLTKANVHYRNTASVSHTKYLMGEEGCLDLFWETFLLILFVML